MCCLKWNRASRVKRYAVHLVRRFGNTVSYHAKTAPSRSRLTEPRASGTLVVVRHGRPEFDALAPRRYVLHDSLIFEMKAACARLRLRRARPNRNPSQSYYRRESLH